MKTLSQNTTSSACAPETGLQQLVATIDPDEQRNSFWPQHFGLIPQWVTLEPRVFGWMDRLCENYCGGIWNLYTLNNGGAFMDPEPDDDDDETWVLFNAMNGNRAEMSPEAAGIAACLMTYSHHACRTECYRIFGWMDRLCEDYCGGIWNLYTLNNGGAFMAPEPDDDDDETWVLFNVMNGNRAEMSPEAAGIAACLMTYSHHACRTECYAMTVHYYRLRDYALQHPECSAIMRIID